MLDMVRRLMAALLAKVDSNGESPDLGVSRDEGITGVPPGVLLVDRPDCRRYVLGETAGVPFVDGGSFAPEARRLPGLRIRELDVVRVCDCLLSPFVGGSKYIPNGRPSGDCMTKPPAAPAFLLLIALEKYSEAVKVTTSTGVGRLRCMPAGPAFESGRAGGFSENGDFAF